MPSQSTATAAPLSTPLSTPLPRPLPTPIPAAPPPGTVLHGIGCLLGAVLLFAVMDTLIKGLSPDFGTFQIIFFRSLFALVPIGFAVMRAGGPAVLRTRRPAGHVLRSLVGLGAMISFFAALRYMPLADVYAISFAAPLFLTALSVPVLGEAVGWRRWTAVLVGFAGVLVVIGPTSGVFSPVALLALAGAFFYALAMLLVRRLSRTEGNATIVLYFTLTCVAAGGIGMIPDWVTPERPGQVAMLIGVGIVGGMAQLLLTNAFRLAPAAVIAPLEYTALFWGLLFGWMFFGELPTEALLLGGPLIVASGLYILHRETRRRAQPTPDAPAAKGDAA
jgi:drug/metabolite transporter (DMT)-like permease